MWELTRAHRQRIEQAAAAATQGEFVEFRREMTEWGPQLVWRERSGKRNVILGRCGEAQFRELTRQAEAHLRQCIAQPAMEAMAC